MIKKAIFKKIILVILISFTGIEIVGQEQLYVDETATGVNNGASWKDAYKKI